MIHNNEQKSHETSKDYILERKPGSFRGSNKRKSIIFYDGCCCCCWHIIDALIGAYIGGVIGSGIGYKQLHPQKGSSPKYRWLFLWSLLTTAGLVGIVYILASNTINFSRWLSWTVLLLGVIGSGIGYKVLRSKKEYLPKYHWLLLWSLLATAGLVGLVQILNSHNILDWLTWPALIIFAIWTLGINPCLCFLAAKRFSWRLLWMSLGISLPLAAIGFWIGWIMIT
jgi:hypothetical protein